MRRPEPVEAPAGPQVAKFAAESDTYALAARPARWHFNYFGGVQLARSVAGVSDLGDMYWTDYRESDENRMLKRNLTESLGEPSTFAEVSPRKRAREADAPVLLIHGKDDTVVPFKRSTAMQDALRDAGKPVEFVTLKQEDHWLSHGATRQQMLEAAVGFVARHNPAN